MIRLRLLLLHACALVISAGVAAGLSQLFAGGTDLYVPAFVVALAHAIVLGIPSYLVVRTRGDYAWWIAPLCGFLIGALPFGLLSLIPAAQEASVGKVATVVGGSYTLAGWIEYLSGVAAGGLLGAAGGLAFGLTVRPTLSRAADKPNWRLLDTVPVTLAAVAVGMVIWVPYATSDRSCHNPLRDGGNSIASELEANCQLKSPNGPISFGSCGSSPGPSVGPIAIMSAPARISIGWTSASAMKLEQRSTRPIWEAGRIAEFTSA